MNTVTGRAGKWVRKQSSKISVAQPQKGRMFGRRKERHKERKERRAKEFDGGDIIAPTTTTTSTTTTNQPSSSSVGRRSRDRGQQTQSHKNRENHITEKITEKEKRRIGKWDCRIAYSGAIISTEPPASATADGEKEGEKEYQIQERERERDWVCPLNRQRKSDREKAPGTPPPLRRRISRAVQCCVCGGGGQ